VNDEMFDFLVYLKNYSSTLVDLWYFSISIDSNKITNFKERPDHFEPCVRWKYAVSKIVETHNALRMQQQKTDQIDDHCDVMLLYKNALNLKLMYVGFFYPAAEEILSDEKCESATMKTNQLRFIHRCLKIKDEYHLHFFLILFFLLTKWILLCF
jgi:hypothetical protein